MHAAHGGWPHLVQLLAATAVDLCNQRNADHADAGLLDEAFAKSVVAGDSVLAGSIVMAGSGMLRVESLPQDSYVSRMTEKIKKYKPNPSPIQKTLNTFIKYMSYLLLLIIIVTWRLPKS